MQRLASIFVSICSLLIYSACSETKPKASIFQSLLSSYDMSPIIETLGYDPCITLYPDTDSVHADDLTIYVHGWGESQKSISFLKHNSDLLPGTIIGFNFKDAPDDTYMPKVKETNFCQTDDIASLLITLKVLDDCKMPIFHLFGTSRGGGTILTTIARLLKYNRHKAFFKRLHIEQSQANRILEKIKAGTLILNCPLVDVSAAVKSKLTPFSMGWLNAVVTHCILPCITNYSPRKDCPLKAAAKVQKLNLPLLIHFQNHDLVLGNTSEESFYKAIMGPNTYLILGNDGGHIHRGETVAPALHAFRKQYNGPYTNNENLLNKGKKVLAYAQPDVDEVEAYVHYFYKHREYIFKPDEHSSWQKAFAQYDTATMINTLGYDPVIRVYQTDAAVKGNSTTVYVHGYGDNYKFTVPLFQLNTYLLPGTVVSFNFQDVTEGAFKLKIGKSSVGQAADIASLAMVLKMLDECGLDTIHLFGYSRGGATTVTTLARLCDYDNHQGFFNHLNMSKKQADRIIKKIQAGTIILNCPLVDSRSVAQYWFGALSNMIMNSIIPCIMEHKPNEDQALYAAQRIQSKDFNILVHFQNHDAILGNTLIDAEFYNNLKGPNTYLCIADEGGHMHAGKTLGEAIQAFRKKYHSAYYPLPSLLTKGDALLSQSPISDDAITAYVLHAYA